jgi:hypothetical protein
MKTNTNTKNNKITYLSALLALAIPAFAVAQPVHTAERVATHANRTVVLRTTANVPATLDPQFHMAEPTLRFNAIDGQPLR